MASITITLPEETQAYIETRAGENGHEDAGAYIHRLVNEDRMIQAKRHLEILLQEGMDSGPATPMSRQDWQDLRDGLHKSLEASDKGNAS